MQGLTVLTVAVGVVLVLFVGIDLVHVGWAKARGVQPRTNTFVPDHSRGYKQGPAVLISVDGMDTLMFGRTSHMEYQSGDTLVLKVGVMPAGKDYDYMSQSLFFGK